jgi:hypothetical protein
MVLWYSADCEGFARTCLTICEYSTIVALHNVFNDGVGNFDENIFLSGVPVIHRVEGEDLGDIVSLTLDQYLALLMKHLDNALAAVSCLVLGHGPAPDGDLDAL